jgi:hypothetical protein
VDSTSASHSEELGFKSRPCNPAILTDALHGYPEYFQENSGLVIQIRVGSLPSISFSVNYSIPIMPYELLTASLNKSKKE